MTRKLWSDADPAPNTTRQADTETPKLAEAKTSLKNNQEASTGDALRIRFTYALIIAAVLSVNVLHSIIPALVAAGCAIAVLMGPFRAFQAITILAVVRYMNPTLVIYDEFFGVMSWAVIVCAMFRYGPGVFMRLPPTALPLICFAILVTTTSQFASPYPAISTLKVLAFSITAVVLLAAADKLSSDERHRILSWYFTLTVVVLLLSLPFYFIPVIGFETNGRGFQGIITHPQSFRVFFAPVTVCLIVKCLFAPKINWNNVVFAVCFVVAIVSSQARTSALAVVCSVLVVYLALLLGSAGFAQGTKKAKALLITLTLCIAGAGAFLLVPEIQDGAEKFVFKRGTENVENEFAESRGAGAAHQFNHFLQSPLLGHGFGIPSSGRFVKRPAEIYGIPISAPTEKGFLPTAILEETGILGTSFFLWWLLAAFWRARRDRSGIPASLFAAGFFVNFGEMSFFSVNSLGLLFFALMSIAISLGCNASKDIRPGASAPSPS